jgi:hypothetical protein
MAETRKHILIWVDPEFLRSSGMVQLFTEGGLLVLPERGLPEFIRSADEAGGFAMTGRLVDPFHGAGVWICPESALELEVMLPWHYVKSMVTAETPRMPKMFGLMTDLAETTPAGKPPNGRVKPRK